MDPIKNNMIMSLVFKYFNSKDLLKLRPTCSNCCLTIRFWLELINEELRSRGPKIIAQKVIINRYNRATIKKDYVFNSNDKNPLLILCFTNKDCNSIILDGYHTKLLPKYSYIAVLKRFVFEDVNTLWTIIIPRSSEIQVVGFSFAKINGPRFEWVEKVRFFDEHFLEYSEIRPYYEKFIYSAPSTNTCLILLCIYYNIPHLTDIIKQLADWYPTVGPVWGATIDSAEVTYAPYFHIHTPAASANIIQIFISGNDMLAKYLFLDENCNNKEKIQEKFQNLRETINLREHSIAFLCTSIARYKDFYEIESVVFKEIFPEVTLAQIFSYRPFGANNLEEFNNNYLQQIKPNTDNKATTFLLISYNN
ncbi:hypothetical protein M0802_012699 [Mischocyttarus mexicanus]|nr:hypothetical protein M0802_012699 [Mischocyttarus mexicanus]